VPLENPPADLGHEQPAPTAGRPEGPAAPAAGIWLSAIRSEQLFCGRRQVAIVHNDEVYILRQTRFGKLILTK